MGSAKTSVLAVLAIFIAASNAARNTQTPVARLTPTTQPSVAPTMTVQRAASTTRWTPAPAAPPACAEATSTTSPLGRLRSAMRNVVYTQMNVVFDAFLVFYSDEHLSEEPSADERRLEYISGWSGAGTAVVLADGRAALWVPSGDVKRARATVSCAWVVLDEFREPVIADWIEKTLLNMSDHNVMPLSKRVGADARLTSVAQWQALSSALQDIGLQLTHVPTLIDQLWNEEISINPARKRPDFSRIVATMHHTDYTGLTWRDKVAMVRKKLAANGADAMVVTALDEVAWLLNVRGRDLPYAPLLKAFVVISTREIRVYAPPGKLSMPVRETLAVYNCYSNINCTRVNDYDAIYSDLRRGTESKILIPNGGTFQRGASAAIWQSVPQNKRISQSSPIIFLKAQKNEAEIKGMMKAHLRDAVAMCTLLSYLEGIVRNGLTELSVATKVDITRATQAGYVGLSMATRVAFGPSGVEPDYRATNLTNRRIYQNSTLIIYSGGQYDEGTTVVTRTLHYGIPSREMRRAYTTVVRSMAALASLQIPNTLPAAHIDPVARAPLWAGKQDYPHPTGHGVGAALNRREDPVVIDYSQDANLYLFQEGYFFTSEPAWYEGNKFGVRLGNVLSVVTKPDGYLGFLEATLLPFEPKLIDKSLLTEYEVNWLNNYNARIRKIVGPELKDQGLTDVYYWMTNKTVHITPPSQMKKNEINSGQMCKLTWEILISVVVLFNELMPSL